MHSDNPELSMRFSLYLKSGVHLKCLFEEQYIKKYQYFYPTVAIRYVTVDPLHPINNQSFTNVSVDPQALHKSG